MKQMTTEMKQAKVIAGLNERIRNSITKPVIRKADTKRRVLYLPEEFTGSDLKNFYKLERR